MRVGRKAPKLIKEEQVYRDIFPIVHIGQGLALFVLVSIVLSSLLPTVFWRFYLSTYSLFGLEHKSPWLLVGLHLLVAAFALVAAMFISKSVCQMRRWVGVYLLAITAFYFIGGVGTLTVGVLYSVLDLFGAQSGHIPRGFQLIIFTYFPPVLYVYWLTLRAGHRFAFSNADTRRIVSELSEAEEPGWWSQVFGLPFPSKYMQKNKISSIALFVISSAAFATFAGCVLLIPASVVLSIFGRMINGLGAFGRGIERLGPSPLEVVLNFVALANYIPLILATLGLMALWIGRKTRLEARRLKVESIIEAQQTDDRRPVLFLRPFYDDRVSLSKPRLSLFGRFMNILQSKGSLEAVLLEEATPFGPVVALGNPSDPFPSFGAARGYFSNGDWFAGMRQLADKSKHIVICIDEARGVIEELEYLIQTHTPKTLFLLHPRARDKASNLALRRLAITRFHGCNKRSEQLADLLEADDRTLGFFFDENGFVQLGLSAEFSEASYVLITRWFLRRGY